MTVKKAVSGMEVVRVAMDALSPDPVNARKGNVSVIAASLREFGQHRPLVVQRGSNRIIAGNHTYEAAQALGWSEIEVFYVDDDDLKAVRRAIADNATNDQATWDDAILRDLLETVGTDIPGVDDALLARLAKMDGPNEEEEPVYPISPRPGEGYSYVILVAESAVDSAWLETSFQLAREKAYKSGKIGLSRAISVTRLRELLPELASYVRSES